MIDVRSHEQAVEKRSDPTAELPSSSKRAERLPMPTAMNTTAVVVTFRPDAELPTRVLGLRPHASRVIIVDNASGPEYAQQLTAAAALTGVSLLRESENVGVAAALNDGIEIATQPGVQWVLTMDQDSEPLHSLLPAAQRAFEDFPDAASIGVIGASFDGLISAPPALASRAYRNVSTVITSGCFINLGAFSSVGQFREELFIDSVDHEYCLRLARKGFAVLECAEAGLRHDIGQPSVRRLFGKARVVHNHSALRRYYMTRNRLLLALEYGPERPRWTYSLLKQHCWETLLILRYERDKLRKIWATLLGVWHSLIGRTGRLDSRFLRG